MIVRELWTEGGELRGQPRATSGVVRSRRAANVLAGRRRIARLLGAIAIAFAVCWTPYHILRSVTDDHFQRILGLTFALGHVTERISNDLW